MLKCYVKQYIGKRLSHKVICNVIKQAINTTKTVKGELSIAIVDDKEMRKLNKVYRKKDKTTDVLSFNYSLQKGDYVGEIFISYLEALNHSVKNKTSLIEAVAMLLVHGFLHTVGYDHKKEYQAKKMFKLQNKILARLKLK